ncbi:MAG: DUF11 domain-containing protein [Candidatus Competibacteraceae bacterium]|nr:DUF11 domain-containing protein [Candidatus Competibacteraceae bacterium]
MKNQPILRLFLAFFLLTLMAFQSHADPFPPDWGTGAVNEASGPIHFAPVAWPTEPSDPQNCGVTCGDWKPYTRFQNDIDDPRTQDPSNGGTAPQNYVNISSSCNDTTLPSIYYSLYKDPADETKDVLMFRWRVEQIANTYATGPSAGNFSATDPWRSALWTVFFDLDGDGYRDIAAHLNGASGAPATPIDMIAGIWGDIPNQSVDYFNDPNIKLIAHNPTAFTSGSRILNFHNSLTPDTTWPAGSTTNTWDYGTTRARQVSTAACTEYFVDYQIPVRMLNASSTGPNPSFDGPKLTRDTPLSMLFCTANSLENPLQKDCALDKTWTADSNQPAPFGDYLSFNKEEPYSQPIVSSVTATAPNTCAGSYTLTTKVQDTLYVNNGVVEPSIQEVKFYYWYDKDGDGTTAGDTGSVWTEATTPTPVRNATLNTWTTTWDTTSLLKGKYLIGVQALDNKTLHDDSVPDAPVNNRTFSYLPGSTASATQAQIYTNDWSWDGVAKQWVQGASIGWISGQDIAFPAHSPTMTPGAGEDWYGNPDVTGLQTALIGTAINACGVAPTISKTVTPSNVTTGDAVTFTVTINNTTGNAITVDQISDVLPSGFVYQSTDSVTNNGSDISGSTTNPATTTGTISWAFSGVTVVNNATLALTFKATAPNIAGNYTNTATAATSFGEITSEPAAVQVDSARISLSKTPDTYLIEPDGATPLTYILHYSNDSVVAVTNAEIQDVLPAGVTYVGCSGGTGCSNTSGTVTWTLGDLAAGATGNVTLTVTVDNSYSMPSLTNSATLTVTAPDNSPVDTTASSTIAVNVPAPAAPAFTLTKTSNLVQVAPGGSTTWTIAYANYGTGAATGVTITDTLPDGFTYSACSGGTCDYNVTNAGKVTWNIGSVSAGGSGSVTVTAMATDPFVWANPATNSATITHSTDSTGVSATNEVGVTGQTCSALYYFHSDLTADSIKPTGATGATFTTSTSGTSIIFTSTPTTDPVILDGRQLSVGIYYDPGAGGTDLSVSVDRIPSVGSPTNITSYSETNLPNAGGWLSFSFNFPSPTSALQTGERLRWTFTPTWTGNKTFVL